MFSFRVSIKLHRLILFLRDWYLKAFNYYGLKYGECLQISHASRAKVVNFDINYLGANTVTKLKINLAYK